jgi:hypothetical protein
MKYLKIIIYRTLCCALMAQKQKSRAGHPILFPVFDIRFSDTLMRLGEDKMMWFWLRILAYVLYCEKIKNSYTGVFDAALQQDVKC